MKTIDFLPDIYRQRETMRKARVWWAIVVLVFGSAIGSAAGAQVWLRHTLRRQLAELAPEFSVAQAQVRELSNLQTQINAAAHEASLYTYLQHPWPRTQLLAEVIRPLPATIRLTQIHIAEEDLPRTAIQVGPRRQAPGDDENAPKLLAAEQDLLALIEDSDRRQTVIVLDGHAADAARLHQYVATISRSPLIADATIKSLEAAPDKQQRGTQFTLRLMVRPGYGQRSNEAAAVPGTLDSQASLGTGKMPVPPGGGG